MNLIYLVENFEAYDEDLIIFQSDLENFKSDIFLAYEEEGDTGVKVDNGITYRYLIEVYLAKEFVDDYIDSIDYKPNSEEIAKRLFEYGVNDA